MAHLGYGRVSTDGQWLTAQVAELKAAGCTEIFQEKISGAKSDRKQLARLIARLGAGDVLVVTHPRRCQCQIRTIGSLRARTTPRRRSAPRWDICCEVLPAAPAVIWCRRLLRSCAKSRAGCRPSRAILWTMACPADEAGTFLTKHSGYAGE